MVTLLRLFGMRAAVVVGALVVALGVFWPVPARAFPTYGNGCCVLGGFEGKCNRTESQCNALGGTFHVNRTCEEQAPFEAPYFDGGSGDPNCAVDQSVLVAGCCTGDGCFDATNDECIDYGLANDVEAVWKNGLLCAQLGQHAECVDGDVDNDGQLDSVDPCRTDWQNKCDVDTDGDGIKNHLDTDIDGDGVSNYSDIDADNDGIPNVNDPSMQGNGHGSGYTYPYDPAFSDTSRNALVSPACMPVTHFAYSYHMDGGNKVYTAYQTCGGSGTWPCYMRTSEGGLITTASSKASAVLEVECGVDTDEDGIADSEDNCPFNANADQSDWDDDSVGDVCDLCPVVSTTNNTDEDGDGIGGGCDNCPHHSNADQTDTNGDGRGDPCQNTPDVPEVPEGWTLYFPSCATIRVTVGTPGYPDDDDWDNDGVSNAEDDCPYIPEGVFFVVKQLGLDQGLNWIHKKYTGGGSVCAERDYKCQCQGCGGAWQFVDSAGNIIAPLPHVNLDLCLPDEDWDEDGVVNGIDTDCCTLCTTCSEVTDVYAEIMGVLGSKFGITAVADAIEAAKGRVGPSVELSIMGQETKTFTFDDTLLTEHGVPLTVNGYRDGIRTMVWFLVVLGFIWKFIDSVRT